MRVLVGDAEVAHKREVERLAEGRGLLVRDVVRDGRDVEVFLLLLGVGLMLGKVLGAAGVVLDPLGDALRDGLARHVVVAAAHAEDAVITGLAEGLGDLLVAQLDYSVEAVFQRNVVVDDLTSLRDRPGVEHDEDGVAVARPLVIVGACLCQPCGNALDRAVVPVLCALDKAGDLFTAQTELLRNGDDVAEVLGDVAAARADNGDLIGRRQRRRVNTGHHRLCRGVEEGCIDPREAESTAEVAGLVAEEQLTGENGGRHVAQRGGLCLGAADLSDVAVVLPPHTVVPVRVLHVDGVLHRVVDVDELGEAG